MQSTEKREIVIKNTSHQLFEFFKDPKNYLNNIDNVSFDSDSAIFSVPSFGKIQAKIINLVPDKKIVVISEEINTKLVINLQEVESDKTKVILKVASNPDCGLFKNIAIKLAIPRLLNIIVESFKNIKI